MVVLWFWCQPKVQILLFFFFWVTFIRLGGLLGPGFGPGLDNSYEPSSSILERERNSNRWWKLNRYLSMIWVVFSIGIEAGGTKRVATSIPLVCFSPDVIHRRPVQAVHLLAESLYFYSRLSRRWIIVRVHEKVWKKHVFGLEIWLRIEIKTLY